MKILTEYLRNISRGSKKPKPDASPVYQGMASLVLMR